MRSLPLLALAASLLLLPLATAGPADDPVGTAWGVYSLAQKAGSDTVESIRRTCDRMEFPGNEDVTTWGPGDVVPDVLPRLWDTMQGLPCFSDGQFEPWCGAVDVGPVRMPLALRLP